MPHVADPVISYLTAENKRRGEANPITIEISPKRRALDRYGPTPKELNASRVLAAIASFATVIEPGKDATKVVLKTPDGDVPVFLKVVEG